MKPVIPFIQDHSDMKRALENLRSYYKDAGPVIDPFNAKSSLYNIRAHYKDAGPVIPAINSDADIKTAFANIRAYFQGGGL